MTSRPLRAIPVAVLAAALLTSCGDDAKTNEGALPDVVVNEPTAQARYPSVVGLLVSADNKQVVLSQPDGSTRTFLVRAEDAPRIGIEHLASHAGFTGLGFRIFYETVDGKDYIVGAQETAPPQ